MRKTKGRRFLGIVDSFGLGSPALKLQLKQAESSLTAKEAVAAELSSATVFGITYGVIFFALLFFIGFDVMRALLLSILFAFALFVMIYKIGLAKYKKSVWKRGKSVEANLLYALQTMQIHVSSGLPLFDSINEIAKGAYGQVSYEFTIVVQNVEAGASLETELEEVALRNPSQNFRNAVWQIVNSIKSGADLSKNLDAIVDSVSKEELVEIRRYGSKLNPLVLMFMMLAVIMPSMGVTVLVIISSLPGAASIDESIFWMLLLIVVTLQIMFIRIIQSKRPAVSI